MICNTAFDVNLADRYYIGMMSGTSLDALDAVLCDFDGDTPKIIATHSKPFCKKLRAILLALCTPNGTAPLAVGEFDRFSELDFWVWQAVCMVNLPARLSMNSLPKQT